MTSRPRSYSPFALLFLCISLCPLKASGQNVTSKMRYTERAISNQYIVVLREKNDASNPSATAMDVPTAASEIAQSYVASIRFTYQHALRGFAVRMSPTSALALSKDPRVEYVEEDGEVRINGDQQSPPSWGLDRIDQHNLPLDGMYNYNETGQNVNAYIVDTGIRFTHQDFAGRAILGVDEVGDGQNGNDCNGHGTHVAGTIGETLSGVAKNVNLWAVRVFPCSGPGALSTVIAGIDWLIGNAIPPAVANMSFGGSQSSSLDSAVVSLVNSGVVTVVAAGNGTNNDGVAVDASTQSPSDVAQAIVVGATDITDTRASFSNFGSVLAAFAPGVGITSDWNSSDTATAVLSGTSMAAPHVAGVAALYLQSFPGTSPAAVKSAITGNETQGVVQNAGPGSPNALLYSLFFGPTTPPTATVNPTSVAFIEPVGCTSDLNGATLTNNGPNTLILLSVEVMGAGFMLVENQIDTCNGMRLLGPGQSCQVLVTYTGVFGGSTGTITINDSASNSLQQVSLLGRSRGVCR